MLSFVHVSAQVSSSCTPSALLSATYAKDVKDMALSRMYEIHSPDTSLIEIPSIHQDSVLKGLAAICNLGAALESDSVFSAYCIHACPYGFTKNSLRVKVETTYPWTGEWAMLHTVTGNLPLDNFMSLHGFTVTYYTYSSSYPEYLNNIATVTTTHALNIHAFADSLALFPGVLFTEINPVVGSGNTITYKKDSVQTYIFYAGWGDCPSGCTSGKEWTYQVDSLCNVTLASVWRYGYEPNDYLPNCNMFPIGINQTNRPLAVNVYPNPVNDILHVSLSELHSAAFFTLADINGKEILNGTCNRDVAVNVSYLPLGLYLLIVKTSDGAAFYNKVIKN